MIVYDQTMKQLQLVYTDKLFRLQSVLIHIQFPEIKSSFIINTHKKYHNTLKHLTGSTIIAVPQKVQKTYVFFHHLNLLK